MTFSSNWRRALTDEQSDDFNKRGDFHGTVFESVGTIVRYYVSHVSHNQS
jgi:hypothetical protein